MPNTRNTATLGALLALSLASPTLPVLAQDAAPPQEEPAQQVVTQSPADLRSVIRDGTDQAERQAAFDALVALADQGDATAALYLGNLYRSGTFVDVDLERAADAYLLAIEKENATAARTLADMYLRGDAPGISQEDALAYYELAGDKGDARALQRLGDLYRDGNMVTADLTTAAEHYRRASEAGLATATLRLGDLYRDGLDPAASFAIYEGAAEEGDTAAMLRLGDAYRDDIAGLGDPAKAVSYYQMALDAGADNAFSRLANLQLATPSMVDDGVATLEAGIAAGRPNAAVLLANAYLNGQGVDTDVPAAVNILRTAADAGDVPAARRLIRLYVDGKGKAFDRNFGAARALLTQVADKLEPEDLFRDTLSVDSATATNPTAFASILDRFEELDGAARSSLAGQMGMVNPNAYVVMLQSHLRAAGHYSGSLSGQLTQNTISAFNAYCSENDATAACTGGPLSSPARRFFRDMLESNG